MLTLIITLVIISILVLVHELGHFLSAKKAGIKVEEFGLGYPPRVWGKKFGETTYSINALPFGGFVRLYGEELKDAGKLSKTGEKRAFWSQSKKARVVVITSGVLANFLLAVFVFAVSYSMIGIPERSDQVKVVAVIPDSPAAETGLIEGDLIVGVEMGQIESMGHFTDLVDQNKGRELKIEVERGGQPMSFWILARENPPEGEGSMGVIVSDIEMVHYPFWQMPFRGAIEGIKEAFGWTVLILQGLGKMMSDLITTGAVPRDIAGPVGILQITSGVAKSGGLAVLQFMGILSVNLAVLNILPLPALDGGRLMFVIYEAITRRRPRPEIERWANAVGMGLIVLLLVLVTANDLVRIYNSTEMVAKLQRLWPF